MQRTPYLTGTGIFHIFNECKHFSAFVDHDIIHNVNIILLIQSCTQRCFSSQSLSVSLLTPFVMSSTLVPRCCDKSLILLRYRRRLYGTMCLRPNPKSLVTRLITVDPFAFTVPRAICKVKPLVRSSGGSVLS